MSGRSVVRMGSGAFSVCHVIISTDQGLGIGCLAPKHHSRVPVARQSREDVTGRRGPYIGHTERRPARCFRAVPADSYDGYVSDSLLAPGAPSVVLPIFGGAAIARGCRRRTRDPHTSPEPSRPTQCYSPDSNFSWTPPVERRVGGLVFEGPGVVDKWAILGRGCADDVSTLGDSRHESPYVWFSSSPGSLQSR